MNKFDLKQFLTENKLTRTSKLLSENFADSDEAFLDALHANVAPQLAPEQEDELNQYLDTEGYQLWDEYGGQPDGLEQATSYVLSQFTGVSESEVVPQIAPAPVAAEGEEVSEDFSKYNSVEELMKEIENSTNEAAHKHKMERVKKAYESLESTATSLEEGEHASYISPAKLKEMKTSAKKLRAMHERLIKEYDKKFAVKSKKKVELNEEAGAGMTAQEVAALVGTGPVKVYKKGGTGRVFTYDSAEDFLSIYARREPGVLYHQEPSGIFAATEQEQKVGGTYKPSSRPSSTDAISNYYAKKSSGGFTGD
jgi:hypothetical protein